MTTSGTYNWTLPTSSLILEAFDRVGIRPAEITREQTTSAIRSLNLELAQWNDSPVNLWAVELVTIPVVDNVATYTLDPKYQSIFDGYASYTQGSNPPVDRVLISISRDEYYAYPDKTQSAAPNVFWFQRLEIPQVTLWPVPTTSVMTSANFYAMRRIQDVTTAGSQTIDVPLRFIEPITARLAMRLAMKYNKEVFPMLKAEADRVVNEAITEDQERSALYITPNFGIYQI